MTISLRADPTMKPRCTTTCRPIPLHMEEAAERCTQGLLKDGVIEKVPVNEVSQWISPAFFVPKAGSDDVRLVTDFTHLNRYVERPVHPFPSASDITKQIKSGAKFFAKMDATKGYHQIALEEESCLLYTSPSPRDKRQSRMPSSA